MPVSQLIVKGKSLGAGDNEMSLGEEHDIEEGSETYSEEEEEGEGEGESEDEENDDWDEEWGGIESGSEGGRGTLESTSELPECESTCSSHCLANLTSTSDRSICPPSPPKSEARSPTALGAGDQTDATTEGSA
jgi:hypothetical protein